jgi:hypothetical protein
MQSAVTALRGLWIALMGLLLVLVVTNSIGGLAMAAYGALVLAVMLAELAVRNRVAK